jgi:hypothetical protein
MKTYGSSLYFGTRCSGVVSFMPQARHIRGQKHLIATEMVIVCLDALEKELPFLSLPVRTLITILTEIPWSDSL